MKKTKIIVIISSILILFLAVFIIRLISPRELDDVTPEIPCQPELLEKADILWIIPLFNNKSIANNTEWCQYILSLDKNLELHGIHHTYNEFKEKRSPEYIKEGLEAFQSCFDQYPEKFKPPQLAYTRDNNKLLEQFNLKRKGLLNQFFHKVYHCSDTGLFSNKFIDHI